MILYLTPFFLVTWFEEPLLEKDIKDEIEAIYAELDIEATCEKVYDIKPVEGTEDKYTGKALIKTDFPQDGRSILKLKIQINNDGLPHLEFTEVPTLINDDLQHGNENQQKFRKQD